MWCFLPSICAFAAGGIVRADFVGGELLGYFVVILSILSVVYVLFKKKYYHLHEAYLVSLGNNNQSLCV